jgi:hypothetical protein
MRARTVVIFGIGAGGLILSILLLINLPSWLWHSLGLRTNGRILAQLPPRITEITPGMISCDGPCIAGQIQVNGSGFAPGQLITLSSGKLLESHFVNNSQLLLTLSFDAENFSPGSIKVTISGPSGSTTQHNIMFIGNTNTARMLGSQVYNLDQGAEMVHVFELPAGSVTKSTSGTLPLIRSCFLGASLANAMAVDDKTGLIVVTKSNFMILMRPGDCKIINVIGSWQNSPPLSKNQNNRQGTNTRFE